jgi:hypothetical protein
MKQKYGFSDIEATAAVSNAISQFIDNNLVNCEYKKASHHELTFHQTWEWYVVRAARSVDKTKI